MSDMEGELRTVLEEFNRRVNENDRVQKLIKKWSTSVLMWSKDQGFGFVLNVTTGKIVEMRKAESENEGNVKVVSSTETLLSWFIFLHSCIHFKSRKNFLCPVSSI